MKHLLIILLVLFGLVIALIYSLVPVDVYYHPTIISKTITSAFEFVNVRFSSFPSGLVFFVQSQRFIGMTRYLGFSWTLLLLVLLTVILKEKKSRSALLLYILNPLIAMEIIYRLVSHDIDSFLLTPPLMIMLIARSVYRSRGVVEYYFLSLLFTAYLTFPVWSFIVEEMFYDHGYLFFVGLNLFSNLDTLLKIIFVIWFVFPLLGKKINVKKASAYALWGYLIVNLLFRSEISLNGQIWHGKWIWGRENINDQYLIFEKEFFWPSFLSKTGLVNITAKSAYKFYLNDKFVGEGPGPIDDQARFFDQYDISRYLEKGQNRIKIFAYNYGHDTHFQKKQNGGVLAEIQLGGRFPRFILATDRTWRVTDQTGWQRVDLALTKIKDFEINSGLYREEYNFTPVMPIFNRAVEYPLSQKDHLVKRSIFNLIHQEVSPGKIRRKDNVVWFEFDEVITGYPVFTFQVPYAGTLAVRYLEADNSHLVQEDKFIFPDAGRYVHRVFGRRGFRLVQVIGDSAWGSSDIDLIVDSVRFPAGKVGFFESSDKILGKMYQIGEDTLKFAAQDQLEDSFVHERSQYLGDAYIDMLSGFYSLDVQNLAKKALYQYASSQKTDGIIETVYPSGLNQTILSYNLMFSSFLKSYYIYTNDWKTVKELLPTAEKIAFAIERLRDKTGIIHPRYYHRLSLNGDLISWIDHLPQGEQAPDETIAFSSLYYQELDALEYLFKEVDNQRGDYYREKKRALAKNLSEWIQTKPIGEIDGRSAVLLINSGALDSTAERSLYDAVLRNPSSPFITGYFNLFYLLAMQKVGDTDGIRRILNEQWGGMLSAGARSTWETFDPTIDRFRPNSQTHAWASGATYFLPAYIAGIRPLSPGYGSILIKPIILGSSASAKVQTACGEIAVRWTKNAENFNLEMTKTCTGEAVINLPFGKEKGLSAKIDGEKTKIGFNGTDLELKTTSNRLSIEL